MFSREEVLSSELRNAAITRIDRMYRDGEVDGDRRDEVIYLLTGGDVVDGHSASVSWSKQKNFTVCKINLTQTYSSHSFCGVTKRWPKDKPNNKFAEMASFICAVTDLALHAPKQTEEVTHAA